MVGPGHFPSSAASALLSLHPVLWSQTDWIPGVLTDPWDGTYFLQPELPSGTVLQFPSTHVCQVLLQVMKQWGLWYMEKYLSGHG